MIALEPWHIDKIAGDDCPTCIETAIREKLLNLNLRGKTAIDGGANIGLYTLELAVNCHADVVHCFEVQQRLIPIIERNIKNAQATNVIIHNAPLFCNSGTVLWATDVDDAAATISTVGVRAMRESNPHRKIKTNSSICIDDLGLQNVGFIKLDIEGGEPDAINGALKTIQRDRPIMMIEISDGYLGKDGSEAFLHVLSNLGYAYEKIGDNYWLTPN